MMNRLIASGARQVARRTYSASAAASNISAGELSAVLEERIANYGKEATASVDEIGKGKFAEKLLFSTERDTPLLARLGIQYCDRSGKELCAPPPTVTHIRSRSIH